MCHGLGLSDGKGTERLWSRLVRLIGIQHSSSHQRRLWLLDQQAAAIGLEMCTDLGDWIKRRLKCGVGEQGTAAQSVLEEYDTLEALDSLERGHQHLMAKVEVLYASLNVHDQFPELKGVNLDFVWTLLLARDIKINIRKRAIGSFFEWDKLDRAVGGAQQALALMTALHKFNAYCERLEELYDPTYSIPLPMPLPTKLNDLRNDQSLMEDVWITPSTGDVPRWLEDQDICDGIRAMLKRDRCIEEKQRLGLEADNLCRWFGNELSAIELALLTPGNEIFLVPLRQRQEHLQHLQTRWTSSLAPAARFTSCATDAISLAQKLSGVFEAYIIKLPFHQFYYESEYSASSARPNIVQTHHLNCCTFTEDAVLVDILTGGVTGGEDDNVDTIMNEPKADLCWQSPEVAFIFLMFTL
ncbi:uncharacterized protein F5147DRAFT_748049 [Suillus discolor]|uniref:Uncharacterized protein n=1 Tax=Suillus discolor TaxID=1912936 RepID=A0A9P7EWD8_9AGAM|nr:uncharacterized protein F5147DRAFT_748463 [Suillus discolor]XP_041286687.1 uncharacterized protein F5147DRAFT_748049 [Suillus discolor]KAG2088052.1 hypothetical protein F5147DRAFT_748463 [Suillus discolor]KAG2091942.1 hypothetical protein F5147DRAFT_748049 [Suillus discolor]